MVEPERVADQGGRREHQGDLETVQKTEMHYGAEPRFPWPLLVAWAIFATWGLYYIATKLVPAYSEWTVVR